MKYENGSSADVQVGDVIATTVEMWMRVTDAMPKRIEGGGIAGQWFDLEPVEPVKPKESRYWIGSAVSIRKREAKDNARARGYEIAQPHDDDTSS